MASCDSEADREEAKCTRVRTFRVRGKDDPKLDGEGRCPASEELGKAVQWPVSALRRARSKAKADITIISHGSGSKWFEQKRQAEMPDATHGEKFKTVEGASSIGFCGANSGCWLCRDGPCYGSPLLRPYFNCNGQRELAYRTSFRLSRGPIPRGLKSVTSAMFRSVSIQITSTRNHSTTCSTAIDVGVMDTAASRLLKAHWLSSGAANAGRTKFLRLRDALTSAPTRSEGTIKSIAASVPCSTSTIYRNNRPERALGISSARKKRPDGGIICWTVGTSPVDISIGERVISSLLDAPSGPLLSRSRMPSARPWAIVR